MRLPVLILTVTLISAIALSGCKRKERIPVQETIEEPDTSLVSTLNVADPRASQQLLKGWHEVEQNAWRWTMSKFSVLLKPPRTAAEKGATLELKLAVPDAVTSKVKSVTLSAKVNDTALAPETFSQAGEYTYSRDVPAKVLAGETVEVSFTLDKFLPPGAADARELGVIVTTVGLEPK
ncbi:MAG: hypothetical protein IT158_05890 [Bryobacterales bacterium]|nr:hypothetical protein [Bryobacterales bacterium]